MNDTQLDITQVCDDIKNMLLDKNMKYGDSAINPIRFLSESSSVEQILVRIDDKLNRIKQGSIIDDEDVINDLIGYFVLLKIARKRETDVDNDMSFSYNTNTSLSSTPDYVSVRWDNFKFKE